MSNQTNQGNQGNQAIQTFLIVLVSVLITAVVVLLFKNKNKTDENASLATSSAGQNASIANDRMTNKALIDQSVANMLAVAKSIDNRENDLGKAITERDNALAARDSFSDQVITLKKELQSFRADKSQTQQAIAELERLTREYAVTKKLNQTLMAENQTLKADSTLSELQKKHNKLGIQKAELELQLTALQKQLKEHQQEKKDANSLKAELSQVRKQNKKLRLEIAELQIRLNRSLLFVKEAAALNPKAAALFTALKQLDGQSGEILNASYIALENTLNVRKLRMVKFAKGSALLSEIEAGKIANDLRSTAPDSFFLVVGYASTVGAARANSELSAKRATSAASIILKNKQQNQNVKAVYLGQTQRFSAANSSENQVCEIWEIK